MPKKKYFVYVLFSLKDKGFYIGYSNRLKRRFAEHQQGRVPSTKGRRPLVLIYYEVFFNQRDALRREKRLKSGWMREKLREMLKYSQEECAEWSKAAVC